MTRQLRIAIVVHGRFHAFDLARELLKRGHSVHVFTNYPAWVVERFGVPRRFVRSFVLHGVASRLAWRLFRRGLDGRVERLANTAFGSWAAACLRREPWDVVYGLSGVCEEAFLALRGTPSVRFLSRLSTHIARQRQLLDEEQDRVGVWIDKPSDWIVGREQREYELADAIHVLGRFSAHSFLEHGVEAAKLCPFRFGVDVQAFRAAPGVLAERQRRLRAGEPLRVLNVGTFCLRKGAVDFAELIRRSDPQRVRYRFVGPTAADAAHLRKSLEGVAEFAGKRPQGGLPAEYAWGDLFLLPTLEDGSPLVFPQALAGGVPVLTTPHSGGADLIEDGRNGWVLPVRRPDLLLERLRWCDRHRDALAEMVARAYQTGTGWDWADTARQTEADMLTRLAAKRNLAARARHAV